jgi:predicted nucleotidyltransferase
MRLTPFQRQVFIQTARECFEPLAQVRLFGSRTDHSRKGGDIDLLIETQLQDPARIAKAHTQFLSRIYMALGDVPPDLSSA